MASEKPETIISLPLQRTEAHERLDNCEEWILISRDQNGAWRSNGTYRDGFTMLGAAIAFIARDVINEVDRQDEMPPDQ